MVTQSNGKPFPYWVNAYELDRCYGGPEEGGWWYYAGYIRQSVPCRTHNQALKVQEKLRAEFTDTSTFGLSSVCYSGGCYGVYIETEQGADFPAHTPRFE